MRMEQVIAPCAAIPRAHLTTLRFSDAAIIAAWNRD
jgi:hypothetical protein